MICSSCGTENDSGFKYCVKCGSSLEKLADLNYGVVDKGNYHSEKALSENNGGFTINDSTFTIRDTAPAAKKDKFYTADELNRSEEEFDFSMYDDPPPQSAASQPQTAQQQAAQQQAAQPVFAQGAYDQPQPVMYSQPQIIGYDQNGQPLYGQPQPVMYSQPQIIGYDRNGQPLYGQPQPVMYSQPQIIGYDQNGQPLYGQPQPVMYSQPQIIGYDQNGQPLYGQPQPVMYSQPQIIGYDQNGQPLYGQPQNGAAEALVQQGNSAPNSGRSAASKPEKDDKQAFLDFLEQSDSAPRMPESNNDFFKKATDEGNISDDPFADLDRRRQKRIREKTIAEGVMGDLPVVDGSKLEKNDTNKINKLYMRQIKESTSDDLKVGTGNHKEKKMDETTEVDASLLAENLNVKSRISMGYTENVNADDIDKANNEHREAIMAQAESVPSQ